MDLNFLVFAFPAGIALCFRELRDEHVFVIIYAAVGTYFAGVMVRLMLTLTPCVCVAAAICISQVLDIYIDPAQPAVADRAKGVYGIDSRFAVLLNTLGMLSLFVFHCTWVTSNAYSSPSVVLASRNPDGGQRIVDDFREAYYWLRQNTPETAVVMSWWDYGYQIAGMADRPTLVDNNTWNNSTISAVTLS